MCLRASGTNLAKPRHFALYVIPHLVHFQYLFLLAKCRLKLNVIGGTSPNALRLKLCNVNFVNLFKGREEGAGGWELLSPKAGDVGEDLFRGHLVDVEGEWGGVPALPNAALAEVAPLFQHPGVAQYLVCLAHLHWDPEQAPVVILQPTVCLSKQLGACTKNTTLTVLLSKSNAGKPAKGRVFLAKMTPK